MKKTLLSLLCLAFSLVAHAQQQWTAPAVPGEDVTTLKSSDVVYVYNVKADAFMMYGMASNNQAIATRLTNGDYAVSIPHRTTTTYSSSQGVRMKNI